MNSVRSPMAAALLARRAGDAMLVDSAGVYEGGPDPFIDIVLAEVGARLEPRHEPKAIDDVDIKTFDLVVALTAEAAEEARGLTRSPVEYWPIDNPSDVRGGREDALNAYRAVRDELAARIKARFPAVHESP